MKNKRLFLIFLLVSIIGNFYAESRQEGVDIFLLIDRSKSLNDYAQMQQIKNWAVKNISQDILLPGDWVYIDSFCGDIQHVLDMQINDEQDIKKINDTIKSIKADGYYTDFGNLMDNLKTKLEERANNRRKKYIFILSDMIQQAPPESKYLPIDKNFSHSMLQYQRIQKQHYWKAVNIGVNLDQAIKNVTEKCFTGTQSKKPRISGAIGVPVALGN